LVLSQRKIQLFQTSIRFLGFQITNNTITPIGRVIQFVEKISNEIKEKKQLQRFLGCLNYVSDFYLDIAKDRKIL
ncbi:hypothetical protein PJP10_31690, partial [Mycobacterium kansasii]